VEPPAPPLAEGPQPRHGPVVRLRLATLS
jgi:hypothetical protein